MKILFNRTSQVNIYTPISAKHNEVMKEQPVVVNSDGKLPDTGLSLVNFPNVTFGAKGMNPDMRLLLSQADRLCCAYSGKWMLMREDANIIYKKLGRRPKAHDAINMLNPLKPFMHDVEKSVFQLIKEAPRKKRCDFQDILQNYYDYSLEQLEEKQIRILNKANKIIKTLSEPVKKQVLAAQKEGISNIGDSRLARGCLKRLKDIKAEGKDLEGIINIFHIWYGLPCPSKDLDAFIVKYANESHEAIVKRLISSSVATVEHVKTSTSNGADDLSNYILVSAQYNNSRSSMPLWEYMMLNPELEIEKNLQKYMDDVIDLVRDKKNPLSRRAWYPEKIQKTILGETNGAVDLNLDRLMLTKKQKQDATYSERLYTVYKRSGS